MTAAARDDAATEPNLEALGWAEEANALRAELTDLRNRLTGLADRWEARADDMHDDARDILLNHSRRIRDLIEPDIPLPDQHACDDYCHTCREPGES